MPIELKTPRAEELDAAVRALREWQREGAPVQLHPGDLGWQWRYGPEATAATVRTWSRGGVILALGMLDGPDVLRLAMSPEALDDTGLAEQMLADVSDAGRGVLPAGEASVEARFDGAFPRLLADAGWGPGELWTPLVRDLSEPVEEPGVRIEVVGPDLAGKRVAIHVASFERSTFTEELWRVMAAGAAYHDARCLVAFDESGTAVSAATVWSAGPGRPGLLEPVGAHPDHRGHGYGTAISRAAAAALRDLGSTSATVCTETARVVAVATYNAAGFRESTPVPDFHRTATA